MIYLITSLGVKPGEVVLDLPHFFGGVFRRYENIVIFGEKEMLSIYIYTYTYIHTYTHTFTV